MTDNFRGVEQEAPVETIQDRLDRLREEVAQLRASRRRLALAEEVERRSAERALHDGPQQRLVALAVTVQLARNALDAEPTTARRLLEEVDGEVQQALDEAAALAQRLYPPLLESGGLGPALRASAAAAGVVARVEVESTLRLPQEIAAAVYFSCADLLGPLQAQTVIVSEDDGMVVFDIAGSSVLEPSVSDAVLRVRDRTEALGGELTADSGPDGSSRARGSLPLAG